MQVVSSVKQLGEQLQLIGLHKELKPNLVEVVPHDLIWMRIHLSKEGSNKFLGIGRSVNYCIHVHHHCAVGLEIVLVLGQSHRFHFIKNGDFQSDRRRKEVVDETSSHKRTFVPQTRVGN